MERNVISYQTTSTIKHENFRTIQFAERDSNDERRQTYVPGAIRTPGNVNDLIFFDQGNNISSFPI